MSNAGSELKRAQSVQMMMLPDAPQVSGVELACSYRACDMLGGDFYDFIYIDAWRLGIVIADVSGHGTAAALVMAGAKKALQIYGRDTSPRAAMLAVNESLRSDIPRGMFLTAIYGVFDIRTQALTFVSCGHNPPLLLRAGQLKSTWGQGNAPVLGILPSSEMQKHIREVQVQLQPDDVLLLYTDGITEAFDTQRGMYGEERLLARLHGQVNTLAAQLLKLIQTDVDAFRAGATISDDETMLALRVQEKPRDPVPLRAISGGAEGLPEFTTELIGRSRDLAETTRLLRQKDAPVITLTGPAGVGKTRVAAEAARSRAADFPGGVFFIDLHSATGVAEVCRLVGATLKLSDDDANLGMRIANALQNRTSAGGPVLVVLDNSEGAGTAAALCIKEWRQRVPELKVLCTSRVALGTPGEVALTVKPLALPRMHTGGKESQLLPAITEAPAVVLFTRRAQQSDPRFSLTEANALDVAGICRRLDGIPMAIELAAARVGVLSPKQILERLDSRFELLKGSGDDARSTLEGTLAWSLDLLEPAAQEALLRLSVFADGFQLDVAEAALQTPGGPAAADLLRVLIQHHLLLSEELPEIKNERRFRLYESVRMFALRRLQASSIEDNARKRAARALVEYAVKWWRLDLEGATPLASRRCKAETQALLEIAERASEPDLGAWATVIIAQRLHRGGEQQRAEDLLRRYKSAVKPASEVWTWLVLTEAQVKVQDLPLQVEEALAPLRVDGAALYTSLMTRAIALYTLGELEQSGDALKKAMALPGLGPLRQAAAMERLGILYTQVGRTAEALPCFERALKAARDHGDYVQEAVTLYNLGRLQQRRGQLDEAQRVLRESVRIAQAEAERGIEANCLGALALVMHQKGERQQAEACMLRCLRICREIGRPHAEVAHLNTLARIYFEQGRKREAIEQAQLSLKISREIKSVTGEAVAEGNIAALRMEMGDLDNALAAFERAHAILMDQGDVRSALIQLSNIGDLYCRIWREQKKPAALHSAVDTLRQATQEVRSLDLIPLLGGELSLARCLSEIGDLAEAQEVLAAMREGAVAHPSATNPKMLAEAEALAAELQARARTLTPTSGPSRPRMRKPMNTPPPLSDARKRPRGAIPRRRPRLP
ncbi:MAG: SpoIIE family protein phosphatase [Planctomycetes bacterium]|nr:SpoIIE family protein phosphatase [Planctomycetota bacterium]